MLPRVAVVVVVLLALVVVGVGVLAARGSLFLLRSEPPVVTYGISLAPDPTGTLVEIIGETADNSLPSRLDLDLVVTDGVTLTAGAPATGARLRYSDIQDGLGNTLPADQVRSGRLRGVGTDGRQLRLSFHVESLDGRRRVVYPIPRSDDLDWVHARVYPQGGTVTCWADSPSGGSTFAPCQSPQGEEIDGSRHSSIRLELRPANS